MFADTKPMPHRISFPLSLLSVSRIAALAVGSMVLLVVPVNTQEIPIPGHLLQAIDRMSRGIRTGDTVNVVYCTSPPSVLGVFENLVEADNVLRARAAAENCRVMRVATDTTAYTPPVPTTSWAKRVAEAADGYRLGDTVWVVANKEAPHKVRGVFSSLDSALAQVDTVAGFFAFPVITKPDTVDRATILAWHRPDTQECPDPWCMSIRLPFFLPWQDVDSTSVTIFSEGESVITQTFGRDEVDAIFFNLSAVDKFLIPYLVGLHGLQHTIEYRRQLVAWIENLLPGPPE